MNQQQIASLVRAALLASGTVLVKKGITDETTWTTVVGFLVGLIPLVWSWFHHNTPPGSLPSTQ